MVDNQNEYENKNRAEITTNNENASIEMVGNVEQGQTENSTPLNNENSESSETTSLKNEAIKSDQKTIPTEQITILRPEKNENQNTTPVKTDEKAYAAISYVLILFVISLILKPDSAFVRLHARQSILYFLIYCGFVFLTLILTIIKLSFIASFLVMVISIGYFGISIFSIYQALNGNWWKTPIFGTLSEIIPVEFLAKIAKENISGQMAIAEEDYQNRQETLTKEKNENNLETNENEQTTSNNQNIS